MSKTTTYRKGSTMTNLDQWAAYYAAKDESERKHGYITAWAKPELHPFWAIAAEINAAS